MSAINGDGYGSDHDWIEDITDRFGGEKGTRYYCKHGDGLFVHLYDITPNIFEAIKERGVSDECVGKPKGEEKNDKA